MTSTSAAIEFIVRMRESQAIVLVNTLIQQKFLAPLEGGHHGSEQFVIAGDPHDHQ